MSEEEIRKLAAIMFTDMVGYSALSQRDDKLALELLEEHRELLRGIFIGFHGTEIKTIGDAFLVEFNSALEAAQCAIAIQRALVKRNADVPPDRRIELKIGIHIGDVVHRGGDVYGDGVNIASRIEPLAGAGGICVSMDVERQIRNAVETRFEKLAPTELKNISLAMDLFRIVLPWEHPARAGKSEAQNPKLEPVAGGRRFAPLAAAMAAAAALLIVAGIFLTRQLKPGGTDSTSSTAVPPKSIAVMPFENLSSDKENAYFADGVQDEILTRLAKIADLKVISRTSTRQFTSTPKSLRDIGKQLGVANVLEGSVQKIANAVHVNVQLIRASSDEHLWAESYNRKLDDVFAVEGEVASTIADQLNVKLSGAEQKAVTEKPTQNPAAYDAYIRGRTMDSEGITLENASQIAAQYERAVTLDPSFALAWAKLAVARSYVYFNGFGPAEAVKDAVDHAVALQPDSGEAWLAQAVYRYRILRQFPSALEAYQNAQKRLPNDVTVLENMGHLERRLGHAPDAETHFRAALRLDPRNTELLSALAEFLEGEERLREADEVVDQWLQISPGDEEAIWAKAYNLQEEDRMADADSLLKKVDPNSSSADIAVVRAQQLFYERRFEELIAMIKRGTPAAWVNDPRTTAVLGHVERLAGYREESDATLLRALDAMKGSDGKVPIDTRVLPAIAINVYADLGQKQEALAEAEQARAAYQEDALSRPIVEWHIAWMQVQFGDKEGAIATLTRAFGSGQHGIARANLRYSAYWDPIRNDSRFQNLCLEPNK